jgi:hypothetical protein
VVARPVLELRAPIVPRRRARERHELQRERGHALEPLFSILRHRAQDQGFETVGERRVRGRWSERFIGDRVQELQRILRVARQLTGQTFVQDHAQ